MSELSQVKMELKTQVLKQELRWLYHAASDWAKPVLLARKQ